MVIQKNAPLVAVVMLGLILEAGGVVLIAFGAKATGLIVMFNGLLVIFPYYRLMNKAMFILYIGFLCIVSVYSASRLFGFLISHNLMTQANAPTEGPLADGSAGLVALSPLLVFTPIAVICLDYFYSFSSRGRGLRRKREQEP